MSTVFVATIEQMRRGKTLEELQAQLTEIFGEVAAASLNQLPYELPREFSSLREAKQFTREFSQAGCQVVLSSRRIGEEVKVDLPSASQYRDKAVAEVSKKSRLQGVWVVVVIVATLLLLMLFNHTWIISFWAEPQGSANVAKDSASEEREGRSATTAKGDVQMPVADNTLATTALDAAVSSEKLSNPTATTDIAAVASKPHPVVDNVASIAPPLQIAAIQQRISPALQDMDVSGSWRQLRQRLDTLLTAPLTVTEQQIFSDYYQQLSLATLKLDLMLRFLRLAIAFNPDNRAAWEQLLAIYQQQGDSEQVTLLQQQIAQKFAKSE
ncbi:MAG: hypothetical protein HQL49_11320 [Gammaproteobacteria bacterium]|nr:hypothetical protein [Gammaproteobacteria bacterium]